MARHSVIRRGVAECWALGGADVHRERAARAESTAGWRIQRTRNLAAERLRRPALGGGDHGDRRQEHLRIRGQWLLGAPGWTAKTDGPGPGHHQQPSPVVT